MRLSALKSQSGGYYLAAFDNQSAFLERSSFPTGVEAGFRESLIAKNLELLLRHLAPELSGVVLDPQLGLKKLAGLESALILPIAQKTSHQVDPLALPTLAKNWGITEIANNYGVALLTLFYHPAEEQALKKKQLVAELADHCRLEGIELILDLRLYTPGNEVYDPEKFQTAQLTALSELRAHPSAFILQYPLEPLACATLTTELDVPWLLSDVGYDYADFKEALRTSLEGGAKGFYLEELVYPELKFASDKTIKEFAKLDRELQQETVAQWLSSLESNLKFGSRDRILELRRITDEALAEIAD